MACSEEVMNYNNVTDILFNTFGEVLHRDTIYSIVESCCGDLNHAANAIMSITSEENVEALPVESPSYPSSGPSTTNLGRAITKKARSRNKNNASTSTTFGNEANNTNITPSPKISYANASASKKKNAVPKQMGSPSNSFPNIYSWVWTKQMKRIFIYHNEGSRTIIIMRGVPGSGKSYLAKQIQEMTVGAMPQYIHIFSTDDYFLVNGYYRYDKMSLQNAHMWNQRRAFEALDKGVSPVIIDNTNIEEWEIQPYVERAVYNGYLIEVVEPMTPWAKNARQLTKRNKHGVPLHAIKRMLELIADPVSSASLIINLKLSYPNDMKPPVLRCLPTISPVSDNTRAIEKTESLLHEENVDNQDSVSHLNNDECTVRNDINMDTQDQQGEENTSSPDSDCKKYVVVQDGDSIKVHCNMKNLQPNSEMTITEDQGVITHESEEIGNLNVNVETLSISEDEIVTQSELLDQREKMPSSGIDNNPDQHDCIAGENILYPGGPCEYVEEITSKETSSVLTSDHTEVKQDHVNIEKFLEEFQKVECEWDNGEAWDEDTSTNNTKPINNQLITSIESKSPRNKRIKENEESLQSFDSDNDWRKIYMPMSSFTTSNNMGSILSENLIETKSAETCMEFGDTDKFSVKSGFKVVNTTARDINFNYVPNLPEKIPVNRKFDKSTMTNEVTIMTRTQRCRNEEKHFIQFRNMFKKLKKDVLRDIFDNCCGDVNWAVSIVMDDMPNNRFECVPSAEQSETEEDLEGPCDCTSFYGIIPDVTQSDMEEDIFNIPSSSAINTEATNSTKKQKKELPSDSSLELKRQLEQNIVISDQHYSEHCLKVRNMRRGVLDGDVSTSQNIATGINMLNPNQSDTFLLGLSIDTNNTDNETTQNANGPSTIETLDTDSDSDDDSPFIENENTVNINLGPEFLKQLDALFGRTDMDYSDNIEPRINMPMSMLNEINALWIESLMCQLESESKSHEEMIKQDEEFARALELEQLEVSKSGKEPEVPNFKEIMDMEFALSLYRKDCEELLQKDRPTDMAAKLSLNKLHDLFPEIPNGDLDEIYMAHHYDFQTTVRVLLESQGRTDITEQENGINKFVMDKELERQERFLIAEKKRLTEEKWPEFPSQVNMETVKSYRNKAKLHLANWNKNFGKARHMMNKNAAIASYYNSLASLHLLKYEQANSIAAVSLLQIHARNNTNAATLDLHFLYVDEAIAALDVFIDSQIEEMKRVYGSKRVFVALYIITGRGLHSPGGPRIKPAVKKQLKVRKLSYREINPGLLCVLVCCNHKLSYQIP